MKGYGKLTLALVTAWFLFALIASALKLFNNDSETVGLSVGLAASVPLLAFAVWFSTSKNFRQFALSLNPEILTFAQTWRILGLVFVLLEAHHLLPATFAWPAGYGDIFIGVTAGAVAFKLATPEHRGLFIAWQVLGMLDLVTAVTLGTTVRVFDHSASMTPMTVLPLSLVPTFLVPLFFMFHIISVAQARRWGHAAPTVRSSAAPLQAY